MIHIWLQKLTKGSDSWSLAEVVHAIVLLAHFHSLSSFVFGCGVNDEVEEKGEAKNVSPTKQNGGNGKPGNSSCVCIYIYIVITQK